MPPDEEIRLDYPDPTPYNPYRQYRFSRLHMTEEAAIAAATVDLNAFKKAFPGLIESPLQEKQTILCELYACYGLVACIIDIKVHVNEIQSHAINNWFALLKNAWMVERRELQ